MSERVAYIGGLEEEEVEEGDLFVAKGWLDTFPLPLVLTFGFRDIYSQLSVTPTVERTCVTDTLVPAGTRPSRHAPPPQSQVPVC